MTTAIRSKTNRKPTGEATQLSEVRRCIRFRARTCEDRIVRSVRWELSVKHVELFVHPT